ncbi:MAG: ammonia-forming cytochrome c nitrite reductase subunit c552, partial [Bacteroidales bacterium]|nr:ammonia-forming cytochrome c nitrite reductase subunit c552 [Bacteroidales bacterium]
VYQRQDQIIENRDQLEVILVRAHVEAKKAWEIGATENEMKDILTGIRHAQWRWDYAAASHGGSFHSPVEISRTIAGAIDIAQEARIMLARLLINKGYQGEVPYPDISTKAKAQQFIGLDMEALNAEKALFMQNIVPLWDQAAEERHSAWGTRSLQSN